MKMRTALIVWLMMSMLMLVVSSLASFPLGSSAAQAEESKGSGGTASTSAAKLGETSTSSEKSDVSAPGGAADDAEKRVPFLESFPSLKDYLYKEPHSGFYLGVGISPIGILRDRTMFTANFFQIHLLTDHWDLEILNASYGVTRAETSVYQSNDFDFRTTVKFRLGHIFSLGPMVGYEFVNFPNLGAILMKNGLQTFDESFSSQGWIYGAMVSEVFHYSDYLLQFNEVAFQESYSVLTTPQGWTYFYDNSAVRANPQLIGPSFVTMIEISLLF